MLHSQESGSSVFYQSQEEGPGSESGDCARSSGAPFIQRQVTNSQSSSRDSATSPGESAALCASEAAIATFYGALTMC